ncbi:MAG: YifB family Mg chelatase-like AAA ATPase [Puniceicoccales bacterium]|jgi:magnesium chelatase family protein|nr:YifB family Mg chelatase-like AAA ATPase [Puniceicoccales bacterium]
MLTTIHSGALWGVTSHPVEVEVNMGERGELRFVLVGLPDAAVKESLDRVCSAMQSNHFKLPHTRTTINLSPGNMRKEGPIYDLPIALAMLLSSKQIVATSIDDFFVAGELSLSGRILPIRGAIAMAVQARRMGMRGIILPIESAQEALLIDGVEIYGVTTLMETIQLLQQPPEKQRMCKSFLPPKNMQSSEEIDSRRDFFDIIGQERVKRVAEIAISGGHNLLMIGSPGVGKSMLAQRIPTIMPSPTAEEFIDIVGIYSAAGLMHGDDLANFSRPFRSPHHSISRVGLVGGGSNPRPGEISLAHNGILFLDELAEFSRSTLESLRQPMDSGQITISRSFGKVRFPCEFTLIAAMNPCPCGYYGSKTHRCRCSARQIHDYLGKISGPLLDRIDLHIDVPSLSADVLTGAQNQRRETSAKIRERVQLARQRQTSRYGNFPFSCNARIWENQMHRFCQLGEREQSLLRQAMERGAISGRAYGKVLKVARTIADLENSENIETPHLLEAMQYRIVGEF